MIQRVGLQDIAIQDIWLIREGGENDVNASVVVYVQRGGIWYEAIRELLDSQFSHNISANGLVSESCKPVAWLNKADQPQE
jgi:hypothetical protein